MVIKEISDKELRGLLKSDIYIIGDTNQCYVDNDLFYKISRIYLYDLKTGYPNIRNYVNYDQICDLVEKQSRIKKTSLPLGVITHHAVPIGVIYKYHRGYNDFNTLSIENSDLILDNIRSAINNNLELMEHSIYNIDLCNKNILYNKNDVQLIDLDGKYIKFNKNALDEQYFYFINSIFRIINAKLRSLYDPHTVNKIMDEILDFYRYETVLEKEQPLKVVDKVEKMKILK